MPIQLRAILAPLLLLRVRRGANRSASGSDDRHIQRLAAAVGRVRLDKHVSRSAAMSLEHRPASRRAAPPGLDDAVPHRDRDLVVAPLDLPARLSARERVLAIAIDRTPRTARRVGGRGGNRCRAATLATPRLADVRTRSRQREPKQTAKRDDSVTRADSRTAVGSRKQPAG